MTSRPTVTSHRNPWKVTGVDGHSSWSCGLTFCPLWVRFNQSCKTLCIAHKQQAAGKEIDKALYSQAKDDYEEGFYRNLFFGAENSVGFHNPTEAMLILSDSTMHAVKTETLLR